MTDIRQMMIGEVVDFCIEWQNRQNKNEKKQTTRKATKADWDRFFG